MLAVSNAQHADVNVEFLTQLGSLQDSKAGSNTYRSSSSAPRGVQARRGTMVAAKPTTNSTVSKTNSWFSNSADCIMRGLKAPYNTRRLQQNKPGEAAGRHWLYGPNTHLVPELLQQCGSNEARSHNANTDRHV